MNKNYIGYFDIEDLLAQIMAMKNEDWDSEVFTSLTSKTDPLGSHGVGLVKLTESVQCIDPLGRVHYCEFSVASWQSVGGQPLESGIEEKRDQARQVHQWILDRIQEVLPTVKVINASVALPNNGKMQLVTGWWSWLKYDKDTKKFSLMKGGE